MNASIVIPTYNRKASLTRVLEALEKQDYPRDCFEVIIVSDGSSDSTNEYLRNLETPLIVRPILQANQGVAAARNRGIQEAQGDIIIFIDDDVVPAPQLISEHMRLHEAEGENVVVLGPMLTPEDHRMLPWVRWEQAMLYKQYHAMRHGIWTPTPRQFFTGNTSLARRHLIETGGFDPRFRRAEDVELAYRLAERGIRFVFNLNAEGHHYAERSFNSWITIAYTYGKCDVIFTYEKKQSWLLPDIMREFHTRHPLTRALTWICLDRPFFSQNVIKLVRSSIAWFDKIGWAGGTTWACSSIFNLRYYQGMADELGGRQAFFQQVHQYAGQPAQPSAASRTEG